MKIQDSITWSDTKFDFINPTRGLCVNAQQDTGESAPQCTCYMRIQHLSTEENSLQLQSHNEKPVKADLDKRSRGLV